MTDTKPRGKYVRCDRCDGHGQISSWQFGVKEPDECPDCGGGGSLWLYPKGALAKYYGGPLIGRYTKREMEHDR